MTPTGRVRLRSCRSNRDPRDLPSPSGSGVAITTGCYAVSVSDGVKRRATYQDVLDAPPHMVAEILSTSG